MPENEATDPPVTRNEALGLRDDIAAVLNKHSAENGCNTPDFILATFLQSCLLAFDTATKRRDRWYSVHLEPCNSHFAGEQRAAD